jgi:hypothetical protein
MGVIFFKQKMSLSDIFFRITPTLRECVWKERKEKERQREENIKRGRRREREGEGEREKGREGVEEVV